MFRLRELPYTEHPGYRLNNLGPASLSNYELLDLIVGSGVGIELLTRAGGLQGLARLTHVDLENESGIGPAIASRIIAAIELGKRLSWMQPDIKPQITSPADAANLLMAEMGTLDHEELRVMVLDAKNRVMTIYTLYVGSVLATVIRISEVFREAIRRNAPTIVIAHNHPGGDSTPSPEDVRVTRQIVEAGKVLNIEVLDHIIIGGNTYTSLKERGLGFG